MFTNWEAEKSQNSYNSYKQSVDMWKWGLRIWRE